MPDEATIILEHERRIATFEGAVPAKLDAIHGDLMRVEATFRDETRRLRDALDSQTPGKGTVCAAREVRLAELEALILDIPNQINDKASNRSVSRMWAALGFAVTSLLTIIGLLAYFHGPA